MNGPFLRFFHLLAYVKRAAASVHPGPIAYVLVCLVLQVASIAMMAVIAHRPHGSQPIAIALLLLLANLLSFGVVMLFYRAEGRKKDDVAEMAQEHYIDKVNSLFTTIRGQRHDFVNHVQVIQSYLKLRKYEELDRYCRELVGEITELNDIIRIGHPAVAALIRAKSVRAMEQKISLTYEFDGLERLSTGVKSVDIVKILGNLIDNAFEEVVSQRQPDSRWVAIGGRIVDDSFRLQVRNPSRTMRADELRKLFSPGYSTKSSQLHYGIGLSIVKERVEHYRGTVHVEHDPSGGTMFEVTLPLRPFAS